jgi:hypothetical protein
MLTCMYKKYLGIECPGCGMQRSFIELLKGNVIQSFKLYPALLPIIFTLLLTLTHLVFRYKKGPAYITGSFVITASIIVISFIIKLV